MRILKKLNSFANLGLRASTLVFRFLLTFYIVKYLGYEAAGIYGLTLGAVGIMPALIGWGLNYFVARDAVGVPVVTAAAKIKTRLVVTTISLTLATLLAIGLAFATGYPLTAIYILIIALVWLETYALDLHVPMIAMEMALQANILVFIRSALWVPVIVGLGLWLPELRSLEAVFASWILSYVAVFAVLYWLIRKWPLREIAQAPLEGEWIKGRLKKSWFIYFSDLGLVGLVYADRYIVSFMLGLTLTGVYTFYWSLTNALQTLMTTAVVQLALPVLFKAYNAGSASEWKHIMKNQFIKVAALSVVLGAGVFVASEILIHFLDMKDVTEYRSIFIMLLLAAVIRSCSDLLNVGLTSMKKDNHYATINLFGVFLSVGMAFAMIEIFGFAGTGIAALATAILVAIARAIFLFRFSKTIGVAA
jgi:O-antigen/teichoic acid export membrane protein